MVATLVYDHCASVFNSMKTKQTPEFKNKELKEMEEKEKARAKGVSRGGGGVVPLVGPASGQGAPKGPNLGKALGSAWELHQWQETQPILCPGLQDHSVSKSCEKETTPR